MRDGSLGSCCIQRDIMLLIWLVRIVERERYVNHISMLRVGPGFAG
jgi:hypothetical protein